MNSLPHMHKLKTGLVFQPCCKYPTTSFYQICFPCVTLLTDQALPTEEGGPNLPLDRLNEKWFTQVVPKNRKYKSLSSNKEVPLPQAI